MNFQGQRSFRPLLAKESVRPCTLQNSRSLQKKNEPTKGTQMAMWLSDSFDRFNYVIAMLLSTFYLAWRGTTVSSMYSFYTKNEVNLGWPTAFYIAEIIMFPGLLMFIRVVWRPRRRPYLDIRKLEDFAEKDYPSVDIMVAMYSEPASIVQDTCLSCLAQDYPKDKFTVIVCDDGKNEEMRKFCEEVPGMEYVRRIKIPGVPHHAKAGNLNNVIMNHSEGDLMLILDCDMVIAHDFLARAVLHFYEYIELKNKPSALTSTMLRPKAPKQTQANRKSSIFARRSSYTDARQSAADEKMHQELESLKKEVADMRQSLSDKKIANGAVPSGPTKRTSFARLKDSVQEPVEPTVTRSNGFWRRRHKMAFLQTPQEFYNLPPTDPMCHSSTLFYGRMFQGFDQMGGAPCCGTGVMFARDGMIGIGGFSVGSITEDFNTAMTFHKNGWVSGYINERMQFGLAPDNIPDVYGQRLRWAMGTIQIMKQRGTWTMHGLSFQQRLVYWHTIHSYLMSFVVLMFMFSPMTWYFFDLSPMPLTSKSEMYTYILLFTVLLCFHRFLMESLKRGKGCDPISSLRGEQNFLWAVPWNMLAVIKVVSPIKPPEFKVTDKEGVEMSRWTELKQLWTHWGYIGVAVGGWCYRSYVSIFVDSTEDDLIKNILLCFTVALWQHYICVAVLTPIIYVFNPQRVGREERLIRRQDVNWQTIRENKAEKMSKKKLSPRSKDYKVETHKMMVATQCTQKYLDSLEKHAFSKVVSYQSNIVAIRPSLEHDWSTKWFTASVKMIIGWYLLMAFWVVLSLCGVLEDSVLGNAGDEQMPFA